MSWTHSTIRVHSDRPCAAAVSAARHASCRIRSTIWSGYSPPRDKRSVMAQRKPPRRTRERILETALTLFNRLGEPNVTTGDIADELNISPGNLYYHFRNKDDIIGELYAALDAKITSLTAVPPDRLPSADDLWLLLHLLFEHMWEYRFFYRDIDEITSRNRRIAQRFAAFNRRGEATVIQLCRGMVHAGAMRASER